MSGRKLIFDAEANNLLNYESIDYSKMPYKLLPSFKAHCFVFLDTTTSELFAFCDGDKILFDGRSHTTTYPNGLTVPLEHYTQYEYTHYPLSEVPAFIKDEAKMLIGHNIINYDLLLMDLLYDQPYTVGFNKEESDTVGGKDVYIHDTLVMSKVLNPDRWCGHSLAKMSQAAGSFKVEFRHGKEWDEDRFTWFGADMLYYNIQDCIANLAVYKMLQKEWGTWSWGEAYKLEKAVAEVITRQEHFGFKFNIKLAEWCVKDLTQKMDKIEQDVEHLLPPKKIGKTEAKKFIPPKGQFVGDGTMSANLAKFLEKHGGRVVAHEEREVGKRVKKTLILPRKVEIFNKMWDLPLPEGESLVTTEPMLLSHQEDIKAYLITLGWNPLNWKDKDLTLDSKKKKLTQEKFEAAVDRYIEATIGTPFEKERCANLRVRPSGLREKLLKHKLNKPLKVVGLPVFTKNADKELCDNLVRLGRKVWYVKHIVEWLTYRHRKNSIYSPASEKKKRITGWLSHGRLAIDGRIPTPADPCGCATSRFQHKGVANVPRSSSLYGEHMRALFMADPRYAFLEGYDADGLEARIEGHYVWNCDTEGHPYCTSLIAKKPQDLHSRRAESKGISRDDSKTLKYSLTYGSSAAGAAKQMNWSLAKGKKEVESFWEDALPLAIYKQQVESEWSTNNKKFLTAIDGRQLPTRSQHSLLNVKFQSAGVICMKWAMVWLDRKYKALGYSGNPFKEDVTKKKCSMQSIAYHDEGQNSVSKELVDIRTFPTEKEAINFKTIEEKGGIMWSDIKKGKKDDYYIAYSPTGELAAQSVNEAGKHFNLNVPLTAGYVIGGSWKDCH